MVSRKLIAGLLILAVPAALGFVYRPDRAIRVATGLVAHNVCSKAFVSGLDPQTVFAETIDRAGIRRLRWGLNYRLDRTGQTVDASLAGLFGSHAAFHDGLGCVSRILAALGRRPLARQRHRRQILVRDALAHELIGVTRVDVLRVLGDLLERRLVGDDLLGREFLLGRERLALDHRIGDLTREQPDRAQRVVIARNGQIHHVGIAIGVHHGHHRNPELARFAHRNLFLVGVDDAEIIRQPRHFLDAGQGLCHNFRRAPAGFL